MRYFKNKIAIVMSALAGIISLLMLTACSQSPKELKPPLIFPISLKETGVILSKKISVIDHHNYYFGLKFSFKEKDKADRARVKKLMGGNSIDKEGTPLEPGVPTPVRVSVYAVDTGKEIEIFTKEIDPILTSWGGDNFKKIIGYTELKPGHYIVRLESLRAAVEFNETPVAFIISNNKFKINFVPKK